MIEFSFRISCIPCSTISRTVKRSFDCDTLFFPALESCFVDVSPCSIPLSTNHGKVRLFRRESFFLVLGLVLQNIYFVLKNLDLFFQFGLQQYSTLQVVGLTKHYDRWTHTRITYLFLSFRTVSYSFSNFCNCPVVSTCIFSRSKMIRLFNFSCSLARSKVAAALNISFR